MEELSKQLSTQLNETITITGTYDSWWNIVDDYNNIKLLKYGNTQKLESTKIIQMYNEVREYQNNINKEYKLDCYIKIEFNDDNLIKQITIKKSKINDNIDNISDIYAESFLECSEKIKKIEELKNQLVLLYGKIEYDDVINYEFELTINDNDIITIQYSTYSYNSCNEDKDIDYQFSIETNKTLIFEIYNQFNNYINSFFVKYNDDIFHDLYCSSSCYIDMSYKDNEDIINICVEDNYSRNCIADITINSNNSNSNITPIIEIYKEVIEYFRYKKSCSNVRVIYGNDNIVKEIITTFYYDGDELDCEVYNCNICTNNYTDFTEKIRLKEEEIRLKEEEIKEKRRLKEEEIKEKRRLENEKIAIELSKQAIELSKQLKEDIIIKEFNNNSFIILGEGANAEYKIKINVKYYNTFNIDISQIYNEVRTQKYNNELQKKYKLECYIETDYTYNYNTTNSNYYMTKIILKYDDCEISGKHYYDLNQKILEYIKVNKVKFNDKLAIILKEEQDKLATKLKLKYGDKTVLTISAYINIDLVISNVYIDFIDLIDIIKYYPVNIIVNGFIKQTNCANYGNYFNTSGYHKSNNSKHIFNITIQNCPNLKIINNIINFENNCNLKIVNCPKIEFIQNYNNFTEIYMNNCLVKVFNE